MTHWQTRHRRFDFQSTAPSAPPEQSPPGPARAVLLGILNLTTDSFSDGGRFYNPQASPQKNLDTAVARALEMEAEGAEIIDIGGESTRPGSSPVSVEEELRRVIPVIQRLKSGTQGAPLLRAEISIDTSKPEVARAALQAGAGIVNDITALRGDAWEETPGGEAPAMARVVAETGAGLILMHMQGTPRTMQRAPHYTDPVAEVRAFFQERLAYAQRHGISPEQIALDPGPGFGKRLEDHLALLQQIGALCPAPPAARPMVWAVSRKRFLGELTGDPAMEERLFPTVAMTCLGRTFGALLFRVHDVKASAQALRVTERFLPV